MGRTHNNPSPSSALLLISISLTVIISISSTSSAAASAAGAAAAATRRPPTAFISSSSLKRSNPSSNHGVLVGVQVPSKSSSYTSTYTKTTTRSTSSSSTSAPSPIEQQQQQEEEIEEEEEETEEEKEFKLRTKQLCEERNFPFQKVKNARDLHSARNSPIQPGRIIRTGRVSDATESDLAILNSICDQCDSNISASASGSASDGKLKGIKTYVDLRSYTELKDDPVLDRPEVFAGYTDFLWVERKGGVKVLNAGRSRVEIKKEKAKKKKSIVGKVKGLVGGSGGAKKGDVPNETEMDSDGDGDSDGTTTSADGGLLTVLTSAADLAEATDACNDSGYCGDNIVIDTVTEEEEIDESIVTGGSSNDSNNNSSNPNNNKINKKRFAKVYHSLTEMQNDESRSGPNAKERHFVSVMNEIKYVKGTLGKVRKRDLAKAIIKSPGAIVSKRVRSSCKDVFLSRINDGGLHMMNELMLKYGAPGIRYVLNLCKDKNRYPIAFYCTAGKDRTGMIAAIMLAAAGVDDEDIVEDYSLSANVYAEMNDHKAMVGALSQRNLDAKTFLCAPPEVMRDTLNNIRSTYGSMEAYLDSIGFNEEDRKQLRSALLDA